MITFKEQLEKVRKAYNEYTIEPGHYTNCYAGILLNRHLGWEKIRCLMQPELKAKAEEIVREESGGAYTGEDVLQFEASFHDAYHSMGGDERALFYALRFALKKLYVFHRDKFGEAVQPYNFPQRPSAEKMQQDLEPKFEHSL